MAAKPSADYDSMASRFKLRPRVLTLRPGFQHYAWGDSRFIPSLLGLVDAEDKPYAEMWMGAHPDLPSRALLDGMEIPLNELIDRAAEQILGPKVTARFGGRLPYLLKVLSAARPLSIQSHPTKARAEAGLAREEAAGIPLSAPHRNYKDDNHKPELIVGLTEFHGLRGFRPLAEIAQIVRDLPEFRAFASDFQPTSAGLQTLYAKLMNLPQPEVDAALDPLIARLRDAWRRQPLERSDPGFWVLRADREFSKEGHRDRGLFSIYLLNLVHLRPGEAIYLPAGILHAYLEGSGMEIMANSNNVLRGGLTPKHVDVPELIENVLFEGGKPEILRPVPVAGQQELAYHTEAREFELRQLHVTATHGYNRRADHSAEILIVTSAQADSSIVVTSQQDCLQLTKGQAFLVPFGVDYMIRAEADVTFHQATVPRA